MTDQDYEEHEYTMRGPWKVRRYLDSMGRPGVVKVLGPLQGNSRVDIAVLCGTANPHNAAFSYTMDYAQMIADAPLMRRKLARIREQLERVNELTPAQFAQNIEDILDRQEP